MLKHFTFLGSAALASALATAAWAQDAVTADTVVATVGETEITIGHLIIAKNQLPPQYAQLSNEMLFDGLIDQLIQQQLLADLLEQVPLGLTYTIDNEKRSLMAGEVINDISNLAITEEALQEAFDARYADIEDVNEFNASHLLVATEEEAKEAKARIDSGIAFAEVARDVSTGPTGANGGNLGWFGPGAMVPEFEQTITALEVGGVSEPFETQFGWHVATLNEIRVQAKPSLDDVRRELSEEIREQAISAKLEELAAAQTIAKPAEGDFDPNVLSRVELLE